ncbi:sensor histidine kinase [Promicromonospora sp. NPDC090134]|uniref:sensor histidine kinase n=1 Tax=Promicromonospora sp. NPDC090134 TaxID=3364408 RepID=UPI0038028C39
MPHDQPSETMRRAPLPFWARCVVALFCSTLYAVAVPYTSAVYELDLAVAFGIATVQCGSLVLAVPRPRLGATVHLVSIAALVLVTRDSDADMWPLPITGLVSLGALVLLLGVRERWTVSFGTWWASVAMLVALIVLTPDRYADPDQWGTNLTIYTSYTLLVLGAAIAVGQRHRIRAELAKARKDVEHAEAQRVLFEERARIARELHDVVAHSMSLVHMQALSAPARLGPTRPEVERDFEDIARSAGTALAEMRQLLGALRPGDGHADLAPQPQIQDIADLAAGTVRAGIPVRLDIAPGTAAASPIAQLTAYRIVQEALSNVARHAPSASTEVLIGVRRTALHVTVRNGPPTAEGSDTPASPDRGGHGLRGMRERVSLLGGSLETGPDRSGGYSVEAILPSAIIEQAVGRTVEPEESR